MKRTALHASVALGVIALGLSACSSSSNHSSSTNGSALLGTFHITAGTCSGPTVSGSYFRMVQSGGTVASGPFVANGDSTCSTKTYSPLSPGTDGGLTTGSYQTQPNPPFDSSKNGVADAIIEPVKFFAVNFAVSTNQTDPQTSKKVPAPSIAYANGTLTGNVEALSVAWNGQQFNQGAPKPGGGLPGNTKVLTGTYDSNTGAYTLEWSSQIVGGPFNGFTGVWHLDGTFSKK